MPQPNPRHLLCYSGFALAISVTIVVAAQDQDKLAKAFEKLVAGNQPLLVDGERVSTVPKRFPMWPSLQSNLNPFTDKARKKKAHGIVEMRAVFKSTGELKVLNVLKRLPYGLTEQALDAAQRIKFTPALLDGKPVSQIILLQYSFNRN